MKVKYLNNLIEHSYSLFTRMKSSIRKTGFIALVGAIIGVGVYGCKKQEPVREDTASTESVSSEEESFKQSKQKVKEITELTPAELEVINEICQKALKEYLGDQPIAWYTKTLHYLPTSDDDMYPDLSQMKKLEEPVTAISAAGFPPSYKFDEIKRDLKGKVHNLEASYSGKTYRIVKSLVQFEPGGGGGSIGATYDMLTIIPCTVAIE